MEAKMTRVKTDKADSFLSVPKTHKSTQSFCSRRRISYFSFQVKKSKKRSFGLQLQDDKERQIYKNFGTLSLHSLLFLKKL